MNVRRIAVLIKIASLEFDKLSNPILAEYELTASQCRVLNFLYSQENAISRVVDIEKECAITHPTVLGLLESLERKGFVSRVVNPEDARSRLITLTEKAKIIRQEIEGVLEEIDDMLAKNLSDEEKQQLTKLLQKLLNIGEKSASDA